jgi:hypothetical protein
MLAKCLDECCQPAVIDNRLPRCGGVEVNGVDDALEARVLPGDRANCVRKDLAEPGGLGGDERPATLGWNIEPDECVVLVDDGLSSLAIAYLVSDSLDLIIEHVGEALQKDQREDVVLELWGIQWPPDLAGGIPKPAFEGLEV